MLILNVPYAQKDEAKALGARWYSEGKKWVVYSKKYNDIIKFRKWLDGSLIIQNELYIVEGERICWKCGKPTPVICIAIKDYLDLEMPEQSGDGSFIFSSLLSSIPTEILEYMSNNYKFKETYSATINDKYWANCCKHCNSLQGNHFLFDEPFESPFYADSKDKAEKLTFYKVKLPFDFDADLLDVFPMVINVGKETAASPDELIKKYSKFIELRLY